MSWRQRHSLKMEALFFVPSDSGVVTAVSAADGKILWKHKISNSLITGLLCLDKNKVVATTMDGKIVCLAF